MSRTPRRTRRLSLSVPALCLLAGGCMTATWIGYRAPGPADLVQVAPELPYCMDVGLQNLNERQARAIREAARDVCAIFVAPRFEAELAAGSWLASCDRRSDRSEDVIAGADLAAGFEAVPPFSLHPRKPVGAVAQSYADFGARWGEPMDNRIAIDPDRIEGWYDDDPETRALLINTLAHEVTHLDNSGFRDDGHGSDRCPDARLASYAVGNIAARLWLEGLRAGAESVPDYAAPVYEDAIR